MIRKVLIIVMAILCCEIAVKAQNLGEEAVEIEVVKELPDSPTLRAPAVIPIAGSYYPSLDTVYLTFLSDLGASTITVTSVSTGTIDNYIQNGAGLCVIPLSTSGLTVIDIYSGDGHHYRTIFIAS